MADRRRGPRRRIPPGAIRIDLPNTTQLEGYTCGPSALLAVCAYFGVGPDEEWEIEADMGIGRAGTDPAHLVTTARRYGLRVAEHRGMTDAQLRACLDRRRPVILMLQAWAEPPPRSYRDRWRDGHWVVAIGHDRAGLYVEDPAIHAARGFLTWRELDARWHDIEGPRRVHVERYGAAMWRPGARGSAYQHLARVIG